MTREQYAIAAQGAKPITATQLKALMATAKKAFAVQRELGTIDDWPDFDVWRKAVLYYLTEGGDGPTLASFKEIKQRDYAGACKRFAELALMIGTAERCKSAVEDEAARARFALGRALDAAAERFDNGRDGALAYAESICQDQYKCAVAEADAPQLWRLIFTVKNRRKK